MKKSGFTLVELLVVISIIAILSTIGITVYSGVQKTAQDTKRKVDINAIAKAYEQKYNFTTQTYGEVTDTDFVGGKKPTDPYGKDYLGLLTTPTNAFKVCATLSNNSDYCRSSSRGGAAANPFSCNVTSPPSRNPPCGIYGDVNADGLVTCSGTATTDDDDSLAIKYFGGNPIPTADQKKRADVNGNCSLDSVDSFLIQNYVRRTIDTFPACSTPCSN